MIKLCSVAAVAERRVIGIDGKLPWKLPSDLKWFKELTKDHVIIMGRNTWESLPKKPLPSRYNIVVTSKADQIENTENVFATKYAMEALSEAYRAAAKRNQDKVFVIGGAKLYNTYLKYIRVHYLTNVLCDVPGDTFYPQLDINDYDLTILKEKTSSEEDEYPFFITKLERKNQI